MLTQSEIVSVCRKLDAAIADGVSTDAVLQQRGVDPRGAAYVAEWRALRVALVYDGWSLAEINAMADQVRPQRMRLSVASQFWMPAFAEIYLDGVCTALLLPEGARTQ